MRDDDRNRKTPLAQAMDVAAGREAPTTGGLGVRSVGEHGVEFTTPTGSRFILPMSDAEVLANHLLRIVQTEGMIAQLAGYTSVHVHSHDEAPEPSDNGVRYIRPLCEFPDWERESGWAGGQVALDIESVPLLADFRKRFPACPVCWNAAIKVLELRAQANAAPGIVVPEGALTH